MQHAPPRLAPANPSAYNRLLEFEFYRKTRGPVFVVRSVVIAGR